MAHIYSKQELVDMLLIYGEVNQNAAAAARVYAQRFTNRRAPGSRRFVAVVQRLRDTGKLEEQRGRDGGPGRNQRILNVEEDILNMVEDIPTLSTRAIARNTNVSQFVVWRTLREAQLYPYHIQRVQALHGDDHVARIRFCHWLLDQHEINENFISHILVTDESQFTRNGILNFRNMHVWSVENPHITRRSNFQHRFSLNVWAGIVKRRLIGPFLLPERMTARHYLLFLQNNLPELLEDIPLNVHQNIWFLHDGAPPHYSREVRVHLNNVFDNRWVGRGGPIPWPPRSPDLNPMDFYFWGYMKQLVFGHLEEIRNLNELTQRVLDYKWNV